MNRKSLRSVPKSLGWLRIYPEKGGIKMPEFFQTMMGRKFYERDIVDIVEHLKKISIEMERANELKERELRLKEQELLDLSTCKK